MKSVSYADEEKWKRLQRMRKASKKKSVRDKVDEEVGISSTVEMEKAKKEAALRRKEQQAVDKEKKALKKEEVVVERLGGKGTSRKAGAAKIHPTSGDWPDSDRGAGNRAKKRAGGKVEKKSPTYLAHVHNKEESNWRADFYQESATNPKKFDMEKFKQGLRDREGAVFHGDPGTIPSEAEKKKRAKEYAAHKAKIAAQDTRDDLEKSSQGRYSRKYSNRGSD